VSWIVVATGAEERAKPYLEALQAVGVPAERLRVVTPEAPQAIGELVAETAGLVLCGGLDVDPARYGEALLPPDAGVEVDAARDALEWDLLAAARLGRIPVWGICRGVQMVNVFLGGSLYQDLPRERPGETAHALASEDQPHDTLAHALRLTAPTRLGTLLGDLPRDGAPQVNSRHHQGIKRLAPGLVAAAEAPDGLIEAVSLPEGPDSWWLRAVQWHPENLVALPEQRALWMDFVRAADGDGR
jgi:putative glutamine amidotransferase